MYVLTSVAVLAFAAGVGMSAVYGALVGVVSACLVGIGFLHGVLAVVEIDREKFVRADRETRT